MAAVDGGGISTKDGTVTVPIIEGKLEEYEVQKAIGMCFMRKFLGYRLFSI